MELTCSSIPSPSYSAPPKLFLSPSIPGSTFPEFNTTFLALSLPTVIQDFDSASPVLGSHGQEAVEPQLPAPTICLLSIPSTFHYLYYFV